jgi:hypothetical protein
MVRLKLAFGLLIAALLCGCPAQKPKTEPKAEPKPEPAQTQASQDGLVPHDLVDKIPARVKDLKPGMSQDDAWKALGLAEYEVIGLSGGPVHRLRTNYTLREGYGLRLAFDHTKHKEGRFLSAELTGPGWKTRERSE